MKTRLPLLVLALATAAFAGDGPVSAFHKGYDDKDEASRLAAVNEIAKVQSRVVVAALAGPAAHDRSQAVRRAAAKALGEQWASSLAAAALSKALHDEDPPETTLAIVEALGETQADAALPALVRQLRTRPRAAQVGAADAKQVQQSVTPALDALKKVGSAEAVGDLVEFLSAEEPGAAPKARRVLRAASDPIFVHTASALSAITGESFRTPEEWQEWWSHAKSSFRVVAVLRCEHSGKIYDKPEKPVCPGCGGNTHECSSPLKTRCEKVPLHAETPEARHRRGK